MYFSSHSSDKQYFSSQKIDENVVFLATTHDKSGLTRRELPCVVTRNETLSGYRNCIIAAMLRSKASFLFFVFANVTAYGLKSPSGRSRPQASWSMEMVASGALGAGQGDVEKQRGQIEGASF